LGRNAMTAKRDEIFVRKKTEKTLSEYCETMFKVPQAQEREEKKNKKKSKSNEGNSSGKKQVERKGKPHYRLKSGPKEGKTTSLLEVRKLVGGKGEKVSSGGGVSFERITKVSSDLAVDNLTEGVA